MEYEFEPAPYIVNPFFTDDVVECCVDRKKCEYPIYIEKLHPRKFVKRRFRKIRNNLR